MFLPLQCSKRWHTSPPARASLSAPQSRGRPGPWPTELSLKPMQEQVFSTFSISSAFTQHDEMIHALAPDRSDQPFDEAGSSQSTCAVRRECPSFFLGRLDRNGEALE